MKNLLKLIGTQSRPLLSALCAIALVAVIGFSFAACDDGNGGNGGNTGGTPTGGGSTLVGKWYATQEYANSGTAWAVVYEFKANGEFLVNNEGGFTYTTSGNKITIYIEGYSLGSATYSISGTALTISNAGDDSGFTNGTYYKPR